MHINNKKIGLGLLFKYVEDVYL